jgi:ParB family chromosome partitioning protein
MEIALNELHFGHEASPPINARRVGRDAEVEQLAASIAAHGLIQALNVREIDGGWYVADGNRRLAALKHRADKGEIAGDEPIRCEALTDEASAEEISLAANVMRAPLHEADQYQAFYELHERGLGDDEIAARFGIEKGRVRRFLALGKLSPKILDAWREGWFKNQAIETVRAFTLAPSIEEQERVFAIAVERGGMWPEQVRQEFGVGDHNVARLMKLIGVEAYEAAGGGIIKDLFGDHHVIQNPEIAVQVANEMVKAKCEELIKEGWQWAMPEGEAEGWSSWRPIWGQRAVATPEEQKRLNELQDILDEFEGQEELTTEESQQIDAASAEMDKIEEAVENRSGYSAEDKARGGAIVSIGYQGNLDVQIRIRPETEKSGTDADGGSAEGKDKTKPKAPSISNALHQRLSQQATLATRAALQQEPRLGLVALLAGFIVHRHMHTESPVRVYHEGFQKSHDGKKEGFASAFKRLAAMTDQELFKVAAGCAGQAVHLETHNIASKPLVVKAITEAVNADEARKAEKLKKADLVEYALKNVVPTGWLPPELRPSTYAGPGAAKAKPAKAKPAKKAAPAKGKAKPKNKAARS